MTPHYLTITPHDPIIARDGRPFGFGQGQRMRSLHWLYPSVFAGSLRTLLGKLNEGGFDRPEELLSISSAGPLPMHDGRLYFPGPVDLLVYKSEDNPDRKIMPLRPMRDYKCNEECGSNLANGLSPVLVGIDDKSEMVPGFWSTDRMQEWLLDAAGTNTSVPPDPDEIRKHPNSDYLNIPAKDERFHTAIEPGTGAVIEGRLFKTVGLDCRIKGEIEVIQLAARVETDNSAAYDIGSINQYHPIGGERRLAHWESDDKQAGLWSVPAQIRRVLENTPYLRMVLATPAIFSGGWKPGWLDENLEGIPPNSRVKLKLISACVERWKPISGWSLEKGKVGPKAIRRLVPAGSVYFFEVLDGKASDIAKSLWLQSVCDENQDQRDGFGLSLWGTWDFANN